MSAISINLAPANGLRVIVMLTWFGIHCAARAASGIVRSSLTADAGRMTQRRNALAEVHIHFGETPPKLLICKDTERYRQNTISASGGNLTVT
jgi:hypothetical protein